MIIPEEMGFEPNKADHKFATPYGRKRIDFFEGGMAGISPNLKGNKTFGHLLDIKETIEANLATAVNESLNLLVSKPIEASMIAKMAQITIVLANV